MKCKECNNDMIYVLTGKNPRIKKFYCDKCGKKVGETGDGH